MTDSFAHEAILFFLDVLYRYEGPVEIPQLVVHLGDKECTDGIRGAVQDSEDGIRKFLTRFPSLFIVKGDAVTAQMASGPGAGGSGSGGAGERGISGSATYGGSSVEAEAVNYFKMKMAKKEEKFLPIVSVAGYSSQSSMDVRKFVGPQTDFKKFLLKYPEVFEVQGEYVALRERVTSGTPGGGEGGAGPAEPGAEGAGARSGSINGHLIHPGQAPFSPQLGRGRGRLNPNDTRSLTFLLRLLQKRPKLTFGALQKLMAVAPENVRNCIGVSREEQSRFLRRHQNIFTTTQDGAISLKQTESGAAAAAAGSGSPSGRSASSDGGGSGGGAAIPAALAAQTEPTLICQFGIVMKVFPRFGIIDNGNSEQVFFDADVFHFPASSAAPDMSALLTKTLQIGDHVCFNAVLGPKGASAKWKAVDVWHYDGDSIAADLTDLRALTDCLNEDFPSTPSSAPSFGGVGGGLRRSSRRSSHRSSTSSLDGGGPGVASPSSVNAGGEGYRDELERAVRRYAARYNANGGGGGGGSGRNSSIETPRSGAITNGFASKGASGALESAPNKAGGGGGGVGAGLSRDFSDSMVVNGIPVLSYLPNEAPLRLVPADQNRPKKIIVASAKAAAAVAAAAAAGEPEVGQFEDSEEGGTEAATKKSKAGGGGGVKGESDIAAPVKRGEKVDMCCQTMSTGPILATGIYMDE